MKLILLLNVLVLLSHSLKAQNKSENINDSNIIMSNSFKAVLKKDNPNLKYEYDEKKQMHNYSGNWDIDGDGSLDSVYFIGNGGAHLYFYLKIILSANNSQQSYKFIMLDFPKLESSEFLEKNYKKYSLIPQFVVADFNKDGKQDIYVCIDTKANPIPYSWKKKGVNSNRLLLTFNGKRIMIKKFLPSW